jgi:hypothetical protein
MKDNFLENAGIDIRLLLAGFFGALLLVRKEGKTLKENLMTLLTGAGSATFLTPFLLEFLSIKSTSALSFFGFIVGFGSIRIVEFIMDKYFKPKQKDGNSE